MKQSVTNTVEDRYKNTAPRRVESINADRLFAPRTTLYNDEGDSTGTIFIEKYRAGTGAKDMNDTDMNHDRQQMGIERGTERPNANGANGERP